MYALYLYLTYKTLYSLFIQATSDFHQYNKKHLINFICRHCAPSHIENLYFFIILFNIEKKSCQIKYLPQKSSIKNMQILNNISDYLGMRK